MDRSRNRRPTIIDVAEQAGVSKSTVARVLAGSVNISEDARTRVAKAVEATGYERNHLAVGMRSGHSGMVGLVIPDITNPFWAAVVRGAQDRATECGVSLLVFSSDRDPAKETEQLRALRQARVDGAVINPVADNFDDLQRFGLPFVLIGSSAEGYPHATSIGPDINQGVRLALDHLVSKGHNRPALILGPKARLARARFLRTVYEHCIERDVDPAVLPVEEGDYSVESGHEAMLRLLERPRGGGHLAVFAANDLMALGAILAARERGLSCPQDVSVLGFDGLAAGAICWPGLTTIEKPARQIGECAITRLLIEIAAETEHDRMHLPCRLIERGSVADLSTAQRLAG
ncbi:MAG TPA: LacI family DNA-binding transcriptional regulator [Devosiaceae bacterium]